MKRFWRACLRGWGASCGAALAVMLFSSCAASGVTYVTNGSTNAYFKVPSNWKEFSTKDLLGAPTVRRAVDQPTTDLKWLVAFDSSPTPSISHILSNFLQYPIVDVRVRALDPNFRLDVSLTLIRNAVFSVDQLVNQKQAKLLDRNEELVLPGGYHGSHLVFDVVPAGILTPVPDSQVMRVNQIALVDADTTTLYTFLVRCNLACYEANQSLINEVVGSFSVKEP